MAAYTPVTFEEKYPHEAGFSAYFQQNIASHVRGWEDRRQLYLLLFYVSFLPGLALVAFITLPGLIDFFKIHAVAAILDKNQNGPFALFLFSCFAVAGPPFLVSYLYKSGLKSKLLPLLISFFPNHSYAKNNYISAAQLVPFGILPNYDQESGCDEIAELGRFTASQLQLQDITVDQKGRRQRNTVFKGLVTLLPLSITIGSRLRIYPDRGKMLNWLGEHTTKEERIRLEDPVFEDYFEIYGNDQIESRRILTPRFMELLLRLNVLMAYWTTNMKVITDLQDMSLQDITTYLPRGFWAKSKFRAAFFKTDFLIAISSSRELFMPASLFEKASTTDRIRCVLYQIHLIHEIRDTLTALNDSGLAPASSAAQERIASPWA